MSSIVLRDYQEDLVSRVRAQFSGGARRVLMVAPTGCGKGSIAACIVHRSVAQGKRVVFLVNRRELVKDMCKRVRRLGLEYGLIMGADSRSPHLPVQVASIDTLRRREQLPEASLVVVDECHFAVSDSWRSIIARYLESGAFMILMTATPIRLDGKGLGAVADVMVEGPTVASLTERGYLVRTRNYAPSIPDLSRVHKVAGDYSPAELAEAMDKPVLVGDIVEHWRKLAEGRPTIAFCVNKAHGNHLAEQFRAAGYKFEFADCNTPDRVRDRLWDDLAVGRIHGVTSVGIVSYGWDVPPVSCAILARPTQSLALYLQQVGRVLRPHPGKADAVILDHSGNILKHGFVDDPREWTLDDKKKRQGSSAALPPEHLPRVCPKCSAVLRWDAQVCPCGYQFVQTRTGPEQHDGELVEVDRRTYRLEEYLEYAKADNDPAVMSIVKRCAARNYKPAAVGFQVRALEGARTKYRDTMQREPQPMWSSAAINHMLELIK